MSNYRPENISKSIEKPTRSLSGDTSPAFQLSILSPEALAKVDFSLNPFLISNYPVCRQAGC
jgi:hypothetical protein